MSHDRSISGSDLGVAMTGLCGSCWFRPNAVPATIGVGPTVHPTTPSYPNTVTEFLWSN